MSEDNFYLDYKMSRLTSLNGFEINVNNCNGQNGGFNKDEIEYKSYKSSCTKYDKKSRY
jgi:hypothetical protein